MVNRPAKPAPTKESIKQSFDQFDYNGNGLLSLAEIDKAVIILLPQFADDKPAIMRAYKAADKTKDGFIGKAEFEELVELLWYYEDLYTKFESIDKDSDRRVTFEEFAKGYKTLGLPESTDLKSEFASIDTNGGGMVLFEEFCIYFAKKLKAYA
ncbi:hypothetical protein HK098_000411 [Nowakowskiella sp. JEL0407]|nr:hypothetical protein HK098_000411 [Nowakowskiella sp. JEL0407]